MEVLESKRQRTSILPPPEEKPATRPKGPAGKPAAPPEAKFLGRVCRLRLVHQSDAYLSGKLVSVGGANKQTCKIELSSGRLEEVHLSTQPIHVLDEVCWGPEQGATSELGLAAASCGGGRSVDDLSGGSIGGYIAGLVPVLLFASFGPPELDAEADSTLRLAQSLVSDEYVWVRRAGTRPLATHMMRRRTLEKHKPALDAAIAANLLLHRNAAKAAKKGVVGKRIAVYWPIDDAWYTGVVEGWDPKPAQHRVLYDDGCVPRARRVRPGQTADACRSAPCLSLWHAFFRASLALLGSGLRARTKRYAHPLLACRVRAVAGSPRRSSSTRSRTSSSTPLSRRPSAAPTLCRGRATIARALASF